jgi:hypothetical protein
MTCALLEVRRASPVRIANRLRPEHGYDALVFADWLDGRLRFRAEDSLSRATGRHNLVLSQQETRLVVRLSAAQTIGQSV